MKKLLNVVFQFRLKQHTRGLSSSYLRTCYSSQHLRETEQSTKPKLDYEYLCDPDNSQYIDQLIKGRKNVGDIWKVLEINKKLQTMSSTSEEYETLKIELEKEALKIPNKASPHLWENGEEPKILELINPKRRFNFKPKSLTELGEKLGILRMANLGNLAGSLSYYFKGGLAEMEQALIR